jgi:hypothetical protein
MARKPKLTAHVTLRTQDGRLYARGELPVVNGTVDLDKLDVESTHDGESEGSESEGSEGAEPA